MDMTLMCCRWAHVCTMAGVALKQGIAKNLWLLLFAVGVLFFNPAAVAAPGWNSAASMSVGRESHAATLLQDGRLFVVGGASGWSYLNSCELYDPITNQWTPAASVPTAIYFPKATLLHTGKVLVTGANPADRDAQLYDPATDTWSSAGRPTNLSNHPTATILSNGKVLYVGGNGAVPSAALYDPDTNGWSVASNFGIARRNHTATRLADGKVLIVGGLTGFPSLVATNSAELYDPAHNQWTVVAPLPTPRWLHTATLLQNGKLLVVGGEEQSYGYVTARADLYDPATNSWSSAGAMSTTRIDETATLLPSGAVLVSGGGLWLASAEAYDPITNTWMPASGSLLAARRNHTATVLANGKVLVVGGQGPYDMENINQPPNDLASAEWYDPGSWTTLVASPANARIKKPVTFTANVRGDFPTGTVSFKDGATVIPGCEARPLTLGIATCTTSALKGGKHVITAVYSGNASNVPNTSSPLNTTIISPIEPVTLLLLLSD